MKGKRFLENRCLVDTVSSDLIKSEKLEEYIGNVFPVVNTGGGNCFFKAFSIFFTGKEDLTCILRLLASIELFINAEIYVNYFTELYKSLGVSKKLVVFFQYILHNSSSDKIFSSDDFGVAFRHESVLNAKNSTYVYISTTGQHIYKKCLVFAFEK